MTESLRPLPPGQSIRYLYPRLPSVDLAQPAFPSSPDDWPLAIFGAVVHPVTYRLAELRLVFPDPARTTAALHCVSRWSSGDHTWIGCRLADLLRTVIPQPGATHVRVSCPGGYTTFFELEWLLQSDETLLAWQWDDSALPSPHGGPLRLIVPEFYAWKSVKWVTEIEVLANRPDPQRDYWSMRGFHPSGRHARNLRFESDRPGPVTDLTTPDRRSAPDAIVLASHWADAVTPLLAGCADTLVREFLHQNPSRSLHYAGPCSCRPNFVRNLLNETPGLPILFFGHGRGDTPLRLLGQPHLNQDEYALFARGCEEDEELFRDRIVCAVGCNSARILSPEDAGRLNISLIGFSGELVVSLIHDWLGCGRGYQLLNDFLLAGPRAVLAGLPTREAVKRINSARSALCQYRQERSLETFSLLDDTPAALHRFVLQSIACHYTHDCPQAEFVGDGSRSLTQSPDSR